MGIGGSIFLLAVGAILAFAVNAHISGIDINIIGWILMACGLVGLTGCRQPSVEVQQVARGFRLGVPKKDKGPCAHGNSLPD